jgi:hypothetical protein
MAPENKRQMGKEREKEEGKRYIDLANRKPMPTRLSCGVVGVRVLRGFFMLHIGT